MVDRPDLLVRAVAEVFGVKPESITDDTSQDTLPGWDSLGMVRLLGELETRFGVEFDLMEIASFRTVGGLRGFLKERGVSLEPA